MDLYVVLDVCLLRSCPRFKYATRQGDPGKGIVHKAYTTTTSKGRKISREPETSLERGLPQALALTDFLYLYTPPAPDGFEKPRTFDTLKPIIELNLNAVLSPDTLLWAQNVVFYSNYNNRL